MSNGPEYRLVYKGVDRGPSVKHFKYIKRVRQGNKWKYFYDDDSKGGKNNKKITESSKVKTPVKEKIKDKLGYDDRDRMKTAEKNLKRLKDDLDFEREMRDGWNGYYQPHSDSYRLRANKIGMEYDKTRKEYEQAKKEYDKSFAGKVDKISNKIDNAKDGVKDAAKKAVDAVKNFPDNVKNFPDNVKDNLGYDERSRMNAAERKRDIEEYALKVKQEGVDDSKHTIEQYKRWQNSEHRKDSVTDEKIAKWGKFYQYDLSQLSKQREEYYQATKEFEKRQQEFYETPLGKIEQAKEKIEDGKDYIEELLAAAKKKRRDKKYERKKKRHQSKRTVGDGGTRINDNVTMETD